MFVRMESWNVYISFLIFMKCLFNKVFKFNIVNFFTWRLRDINIQSINVCISMVASLQFEICN